MAEARAGADLEAEAASAADAEDSEARITIINRNVPNMIGSFTAIFAKEGINIANMSNGSKGAYAYTVLELDEAVPAGTEEALSKIEGVIRVRTIA